MGPTAIVAGSRRRERRALEGGQVLEGPHSAAAASREGTERPVVERYPYELRLPEAPYRFEWRGEAAVDARKHTERTRAAYHRPSA